MQLVDYVLKCDGWLACVVEENNNFPDVCIKFYSVNRFVYVIVRIVLAYL